MFVLRGETRPEGIGHHGLLNLFSVIADCVRWLLTVKAKRLIQVQSRICGTRFKNEIGGILSVTLQGIRYDRFQSVDIMFSIQI